MRIDWAKRFGDSGLFLALRQTPKRREKFFIPVLMPRRGGKGAFYTVGGNVNWCNHYGKQYGSFSKN